MPSASRNINTSSIFHTLKAREMMNNWNPFGQPGSGAPNVDIRIRNLEMDGLFPTDKNVVRQSHTLPRAAANHKNYISRMQGISGGSGAPIRNEAGKLLVPLREDPMITFSDSTRNFVEKDLRYRSTPMEQNAYRHELDKIVQDKNRRRNNEKYGTEYNSNYDLGECWGRPGPGGAPWRDPKTVGQNFMKSMGWTTKDTLRSMNYDINDRNYAQNYSPPKFNNNMTTGKKPLNCCDRCSCECIKKIENTILRSNSPPKLSKENYQPNGFNELSHHPQQQEISPKKTPHYALPQQCNRQQQLEPLQPAQLSSISRPKPRFSPVKKQSRTSLLSGGVELVPLLAKRRDERPISLSTTDITKYKINKSSGQDGDPEYLGHLDRQVMQKQRLRKLSHDREVETSQKHFQKFDSFWGRPGGGAPLQNKNKLNLDDLLYNTPMYQPYQQY